MVADQSNQDYTATPIPLSISGHVTTPGGSSVRDVVLTASNGGGSDTTDFDGFYELWVTYGWSGQVTPSRPGYTFNPASQSYANVYTVQVNQNYSGTLLACPGDMNCDGRITFADIDPFVEALSGEPAWTHWPCPWASADCNHDGNVTFADIDPFVAVIGTTCP